MSLAGRVAEPVTLRIATSAGIGAGVAEAQATLGDYFVTERVITLDAMNTSAEFRVRIIEDLIIQTPELVFASILEVDGPAVLPFGESQAVSLIIDDDSADQAAFSVESVSEFEGDGNTNTLDFVISLNVDPAIVSGPVTVDVMTRDDSAG